MKINGREIGFAFTIGAYCDLCDYAVANPEVSTVTADIHKAVIMNREYNKMTGATETITVEELRALPGSEYLAIKQALKAAEQEGTKRTVEAVEKKPKVKG